LIAAARGRLDVVTYLVERGADIHFTSDTGANPIVAACEGGNLEVVKYLLSQGAVVPPPKPLKGIGTLEVNMTGDNNTHNTDNTLNNDTTGQQQLQQLQQQLQQGSSEEEEEEEEEEEDQEEERDEAGRRVVRGLLHAAVTKGHLEVTRFLVKNLGLSETEPFRGFTPLCVASVNGHPEIVKFLILETDHGRDTVETMCKKATPLCQAARRGYTEVVRLLLEEGKASVDKCDAEGCSPLNLAIYGKCAEVVPLLLKHGANPNGLPGDEEIPLLQAIAAGSLDIVKCLVENSADVNVRAAGGFTPAHIASQVGHVEILKYLHEKGADLTLTIFETLEIPLHVAAGEDKVDALRYLCTDGGSSLQARAGGDKTPLHYACLYGNTAAAKVGYLFVHFISLLFIFTLFLIFICFCFYLSFYFFYFLSFYWKNINDDLNQRRYSNWDP